MTLIIKFIFKLFGWKLALNEQEWPKKCLIVVAPHTSNWDYIVCILLKFSLPVKTHYIGKKELFVFPFAWFFKLMGGAPIKREKQQNQVQAIINLFNNKEEFRLGLAPEGTRQKAKWKTGFYHIALGAKIPIRMLRLDYKNKTASSSENIALTGNESEDFNKINDFFDYGDAKYPELFENIIP